MQLPLSRGPSFCPLPSPASLASVHLSLFNFRRPLLNSNFRDAAVNVALTFCMGQDLEDLMASSLGQPMAQIFFNSFGKKGTLTIWLFVILAQYMMGSSMVCLLAFPRTGVR